MKYFKTTLSDIFPKRKKTISDKHGFISCTSGAHDDNYINIKPVS